MRCVGPEELLFDRFRRRGDAAALGELFDRTAPALLRVALHLVRDPSAAEDLLQGTFLRAIEARDEWDAQRPLLPWLCGILQNRARHARWELGRAPDPARLEPAPPIDPARAAEHAEFGAAVDAAIAELPEVYRAVLRLHLGYGHTPAEIAHALDRPPATVRSQLARGLALLRRALPAALAGAGVLAVTSTRGLAAVRGVVIGQASLATTAASVGSVVGGAVMMKKVLALAGGALVIAAVWFLQPAPDAAPQSHEGGGGVIPETADVPPPVAAEAPAPAFERIPLAPREVARTGSLRIRCRHQESNAPGVGVWLGVRPLMREGDLLERAVQTTADGIAVVADLPPGEAWVYADRGGAMLRVPITAGREALAELVIPAGVTVRGRVVDPERSGIASAHVWLSEEPGDYCDGRFVATTDAAGRFLLHGVQPERFVGATARSWRSTPVRPVRGEPGETVEIELALEPGGATLCGTVVDERGAALADAKVFVGIRELWSTWSEQAFRDHRPPVETETDSDGRFAVHGLRPGSRHLVWARAAGYCVRRDDVQLEPDGDTSVTVRLEAGATLEGRVTDGDGAPVADATVGYQSSAWQTGERKNFDGPAWAFSSARTGADGRYRLEHITPGTLHLYASNDRLECWTDLPVVSGESARWDPVVVTAVIRGRVLDERGTPMAGVTVYASPPRGLGNLGSATTDEHGAFACTGLTPVPYVLTFHGARDPANGELPLLDVTVRGLVPNHEPVVVRVPDTAVACSWIVGKLVGRDGLPQPGAAVSCSGGRMNAPHAPVAMDAESGTFSIGPVPADRYLLEVYFRDPFRVSSFHGPLVVAHGARLDVGTIRMQPPGSVAIRCTGTDGAPLDGVPVALAADVAGFESWWSAGKLANGTVRVDTIEPGAYRCRVGGGGDLPVVHHRFAVTSGTETTVELRMPQSTGVQLVLSGCTEPVPIQLEFVWTRDGQAFQRYSNRWEMAGPRTWLQRLTSGTYRLAITSETGRRVVNDFVIAADDPEGRRIDITLP